MNNIPAHSSVTKDLLLRLLFLNMVLVIAGYALGVLTGMASVGPMRAVKYSVLFISILFVLKINQSTLQLLAYYLQSLFVLSFTFLLFALFTSDPLNSMLRVLTFIVPFLYVAFSVGYLLLCYPIAEVLHGFIGIINWVYLIPIVSYFVTGGELTDTNIYQISSKNEESAFVSNHYGWAGTIFLLTGLDLLRNVSLPIWRRIIIIVLGVFSSYLILISGNRTSLVCLILVGLVFIVKYKGIPLYQKFLLSLIPLGMVYYLAQDPTSALNTRLEDSRKRELIGEARVTRFTSFFNHFNENPDLWVTGIGMFNSSKIYAIATSSGYHNSYYEVLFGSGVIIFAFFLYIVVIRPLWFYLRIFATYYLFFIPLLVIPFFESNLTGGQFLFFPWFIMAVLFSYCHKFASMKEHIRELTPSDMQKSHSNDHS